ncbi:HAD family hydrolase [Candidatus Neomarinimicrobiota bacterium]
MEKGWNIASKDLKLDLAYEQDYQRTTVPESIRFLNGTQIELIRDVVPAEPPEHVLFDFDGTLSLIREGWIDVMATMMVEILQATNTSESPEHLREVVIEFILRLNGKQTIYQMFQLAEEVRQRGGKPKEPLEYKQDYHRRLMERIHNRREALRSERTAPDSMLVPYATDLLSALQDKGVQLYVASGTDQCYVEEEIALLELDRFFANYVYGALEDHRAFSKAMVIERILRENNVDGTRLLGFGDGYVEIENIKSVGGIAVAVASDEAGRSGRPDPWKRDRLIGIGADIVIPDFQDYAALVQYLWRSSDGGSHAF